MEIRRIPISEMPPSAEPSSAVEVLLDPEFVETLVEHLNEESRGDQSGKIEDEE